MPAIVRTMGVTNGPAVAESGACIDGTVAVDSALPPISSEADLVMAIRPLCALRAIQVEVDQSQKDLKEPLRVTRMSQKQHDLVNEKQQSR